MSEQTTMYTYVKTKFVFASDERNSSMGNVVTSSPPLDVAIMLSRLREGGRGNGKSESCCIGEWSRGVTMEAAVG